MYVYVYFKEFFVCDILAMASIGLEYDAGYKTKFLLVLSL